MTAPTYSTHQLLPLTIVGHVDIRVNHVVPHNLRSYYFYRPNRPSANFGIALLFAFGALAQMRAQDNKNPYPNMAPLGQYMIPDRQAEIALARSAAPEDISRDATILIMGRHGYETAVEGKNGFVCLVERAWLAPFDNPEFWNSKNRSPDCYNPPAARTVLPLIKMRTQMVLAGLSKEQIIEKLKTAKAKKQIPAVAGRDGLHDVQAGLPDRPGTP